MKARAKILKKVNFTVNKVDVSASVSNKSLLESKNISRSA
jgi:hypothetical protein